MPTNGIRLLPVLCLLALPLAGAPAHAQTAPAQTAPAQTAPAPVASPAAAQPTPQELLRKIDSAIYVADKARSTAAKARTAGYVLLGITLLNLVGTAVLLRRRQPVAAAAPGGAPAAP